MLPPHQFHQAQHRYGGPDRQGKRRKHGLALRRTDIDRQPAVGGNSDAIEETDPNH
jgi:hypothetical protein